MWATKSLLSTSSSSFSYPSLFASTKQSPPPPHHVKVPPTAVSTVHQRRLNHLSSSSCTDHLAVRATIKSSHPSDDDSETLDTNDASPNRIQTQKRKQQGGNELSGSVVLMALQKAHARKKSKLKKKAEMKKKEVDKISSDQANENSTETAGDNNLARPLRVKNVWGRRIEELERRLQSLFIDI